MFDKILWASFVLIAVITQFVGVRFFGVEHPYHPFDLQSVFAAVNFVQGLWILIRNRFAWRKTLIVIGVFMLGQWKFLLWSAVFIGWKINGFAP